MRVSRDPQRTRAVLIQAAFDIVRYNGVSALTLDEVAQQAGVSKGGLLHHFANKEALVAAMLDTVNEEFDRAMLERLRIQETVSNPGSWLRAYIEANVEVASHSAHQGIALLTAAATNPRLLKANYDHFAVWQRRLENDGVDPALARLIFLAIDGLFIYKLLGVSSIDDVMQERIIATLMRLIELDTQE
jgi:AcrR family transcriptional regulator